MFGCSTRKSRWLDEELSGICPMPILYAILYSSAILCRRKKNNTLVVVKELFADMTDDERTTSVNEIQVLSMLRHPNIIAYVTL